MTVLTQHRPRGRIALYSHDAQGLGHVRRNLKIATALTRIDPAPDVLVVSGSPEAAALPRPRHCDIVTLPSVAKTDDGGYRSRHLNLSLRDISGVRSAVAYAALTAFDPDLLVVDKHPRGLLGELEPALTTLRGTGRTRIVLGLRDVLDDPAAARREWRADRGDVAVARWYDAIWVYGDARVHDLVEDLQPAGWLRARAVHTGYLADAPVRSERRRSIEQRRGVLCTVGGGSDGVALAQAFAAVSWPAGVRAVLVAGPHLPNADRAAIARLAAEHPQLRIHDFVAGTDQLLDQAHAVVTMGGYNSVLEAVARRLPTLVVPRVRPRTEQLVRAREMGRLGLVDVLHPDQLSADRVGHWVAHALARGRSPEPPIDLGGLARLPRLVEALVGQGAGASSEVGSRAVV